MTDTKKRNYNLIFDTPDNRDFLFKSPTLAEELPESVDLKPLCSPVEQQGSIGSCTANACVSMLEFLDLKKEKTYYDLSRLFTYYCTRKLQNTVRYDSGASLRITLKSLAKYGTPKETIWPYIESKYRIKPSDQAFEDALNHQILYYMKLYNLEDFKRCLKDGFPFVCGIQIFSSFESAKVDRTGIVPIPKASERNLGGHAIMITGYDDSTEMFSFKNSWGTNWGEGGFGSIPYKFLTNPKLASDFWMIKKAE